MIRRRQDWPVRLSEYLTEAATKKFRWGSHDCVLHCCNAVLAMTDVDIAEGHRNVYRGKASAARHRDEVFGGTMDNGFSEYFGSLNRGIGKAKRGDIVKGFMRDTGEEVYGVVDDSGRMAAMVGPDGMDRVPLSEFVGFWKVG